MNFISILYLFIFFASSSTEQNSHQKWPSNPARFGEWISKLRSKREVLKNSQRVVGGIAAKENKFPWVVYFHAISKKRKNGSEDYGSVTNFCGGSLIHPR